jgi:hypothetical protein
MIFKYLSIAITIAILSGCGADDSGINATSKTSTCVQGEFKLKLQAYGYDFPYMNLDDGQCHVSAYCGFGEGLEKCSADARPDTASCPTFILTNSGAADYVKVCQPGQEQSK